MRKTSRNQSPGRFCVVSESRYSLGSYAEPRWQKKIIGA